MRRLALLLVLLTAGAARAEGPDPVKVEEAIQKGARWISEQIKQPGRTARQGELALAVMALRRAGVPASELRDQVDALKAMPFHQTYDVSLYLLAIDALHVERTPPDPGKGKTRARHRQGALPAAALLEIRRAADWLQAGEKEGRWSYTQGHVSAWDNSNTQFAVYALHTASTRGVSIPPAVFARIVKHLSTPGPLRVPDGTVEFDARLAGGSPLSDEWPRTRTGSKGGAPATRSRAFVEAAGWGYRGNDGGSPAMTCAGLSSLGLAAERLAALAPRSFEADPVRANLRAGTVGALKVVPASGGDGYTLYALEKAMAAVGLESLGGQDWWAPRASAVLAAQQRNGSWTGGQGGGTVETAFMVLFLDRATLSPFEPAPAKSTPRQRTATGADAGPNSQLQVVLPSGQRCSPAFLLDTALGLKGKPGDAVLTELRGAWSALDQAERVALLPRLGALIEGGARQEARIWARQAMKELLGRGAGDRTEADAVTAALAALEGPEEGRRAAVLTLRGLVVPDRRERAPDALRRAALTALVRCGDAEGAVPPLLGDMARSDAGDRRFAWGLLAALAGEARPFDTEAQPAERTAALREWRAWWEGPEGRALAGR